MIEILFTPSFDRILRKVEPDLLEEISKAVEAFKDPKRHGPLRVNKLHGHLAGYHAFSVDYRHRVVFRWIRKGKTALLLDFGDHSVYE